MDSILEWYCADKYLEEVQGDLHEWYASRYSQHPSTARIRYLLAVFQYFTLQRTKPFQNLISHPKYLTMKNILLLTYRNFLKNKLSGSIRLVNLVVGIGVFLLAFTYAKYELAYDAYHEKANGIYRVGYSFDAKPWAATPVGLGSYALENVAEVQGMTRFLRIWETTISYKDKQFYETGGFMADSSIFELFSYSMLRGNPTTALKEKMSIVLTESLAKKYFGNEDPIGKSLTLSMDLDSETGVQGTRMVTGIIEDIPEQSHLRFDFICPAHTLRDERLREWRNFWVYTYLDLGHNPDLKQVRTLLKDKYVDLRGMDEETSRIVEVVLTPIRKIHLYTNHEKEYADNGNIYNVWILFSIGLFILVVSSINFVNLTIIQGLDRAREVGLRKTVGASRYQLVLQFMSENLVLLLLAGISCILLLAALTPLLQEFSGLNLPLNAYHNPVLLLYILVILVALQMVSGIYPALVLSKFQPADIIKTGGRSIPLKRVGYTRKVLIVMQFTISLVLVIASIIVYDQLNFIQTKDLGFQKDQVLLLNHNRAIAESFSSFENELRSQPGIISVSTSSSVPGYRIMMEGTQEIGSEDEYHTRLLLADDSFLETFDVELITGKPFKPKIAGDWLEYYLNESAAKQLFGDRDPINKPIYVSRDSGYVVGVVRDFNFKSLHSDIEPLTIRNLPESDFGFISIKFDAQRTSDVIATVEQAYRKVFPHLPSPDYEFLDNRFEHLYFAEIKLKTVVWVFCMITIVLTISGIIGIATYSARKRVKEIAIRKVLGGDLKEMIFILSKSFLVLLVISLMIGLPGAFFLSDWWLQDFAYRIYIGPGIFVLSTLVLAFVVLVSFSWVTFTKVKTNPAKVLRSE